MDVKLYRHQDKALKYLDKAYACLLWATMGTGKTRTVCEYIKTHKPRRVLIVCPLSIISVWEAELEKWGVIKPVSVRVAGTDIVLVNYEKL